jgi:hypothetical protein
MIAEAFLLLQGETGTILLLGMRQKWAILLDSVELVQAQHCQVDLTHALGDILMGKMGHF